MTVKMLALAVLVLSVNAGAQNAEFRQDAAVWSMEGSSDYHRFDCPLKSSHPISKTSLLDALAHGLKPCLICHPERDAEVARAIRLNAERADPSLKYEDVSYVLRVTTPLRAAPDQAARIISQLPPLTLAKVMMIESGWVQILPFPFGQDAGWVAGDSESLLEGPPASNAERLSAITKKTWLAQTKQDVVFRKVKIGFTSEQVALGLGSPTTKTKEETAAGITELWAYPGRVVVLKADRVTAIRTVE